MDDNKSQDSSPFNLRVSGDMTNRIKRKKKKMESNITVNTPIPEITNKIEVEQCLPQTITEGTVISSVINKYFNHLFVLSDNNEISGKGTRSTPSYNSYICKEEIEKRRKHFWDLRESKFVADFGLGDKFTWISIHAIIDQECQSKETITATLRENSLAFNKDNNLQILSHADDTEYLYLIPYWVINYPVKYLQRYSDFTFEKIDFSKTVYYNAQALGSNKNLLEKDKSVLSTFFDDLAKLRKQPIMNCTIKPLEESGPFDWQISIDGPESSYYGNATYLISYTIDNNYPTSVPKIQFDTKIYHPNIDIYGNITIDWETQKVGTTLDIKIVLEKIKDLLIKPDEEKTISHEILKKLQNRVEDYKQNVRSFIEKYAHSHEKNAIKNDEKITPGQNNGAELKNQEKSEKSINDNTDQNIPEEVRQPKEGVPTREPAPSFVGLRCNLSRSTSPACINSNNPVIISVKPKENKPEEVTPDSNGKVAFGEVAEPYIKEIAQEIISKKKKKTEKQKSKVNLDVTPKVDLDNQKADIEDVREKRLSNMTDDVRDKRDNNMLIESSKKIEDNNTHQEDIAPESNKFNIFEGDLPPPETIEAFNGPPIQIENFDTLNS